MLEIYTGKVGGGKSFHATRTMVRSLASGHRVYSNIQLRWPAVVAYCAKHYGVEPSADQYRYIPDEEIPNAHQVMVAGTQICKCLLVVDEAQLWFNSRDHAQTFKHSRGFLTYLTQHRKLAHDVIFVTQHEHNIDTQFLRLAQFIWRYRDMRTMVVPILGLRYPFKHFLCVQCDADGRTQLDSYIRTISSEIFPLYDSFALLKPIDISAEPPKPVAVKQTKKPMRPLVVIGILFLLPVLFFGAQRLLLPSAKAAMPAASSQLAAPVAKTEPQDRTEHFCFASMDLTRLKTQEGTYTLGQRTAEGQVVEIAWDRVMIVKNKRAHYVYVENDPVTIRQFCEDREARRSRDPKAEPRQVADR